MIAKMKITIRKLKIKAAGLMLGAAMLAGCSSTVTDADVRHETDQAVQEASDQLNNLANLTDENVLAVKNGTFNEREDVTLGEVMEAFFDGPTWQYFSGTDEETGETYDVVEFTGYFLYNEKSAKARIQFILHEDDTFEMGAGSYNDIDQTALVLGAMIEKVYESYDEGEAAEEDTGIVGNGDAEGRAFEDAKTTTAAEVETEDQVEADGEPESAEAEQAEYSEDVAFGLASFQRWTPGDEDLVVPLMLDGEEVEIVLGRDTPNGTKTQVFSTSMQQGWELSTELADGNMGPFDEYGDLVEGFSLYVTEYDFAGDGVPEVVLAASDQMLETYVWVYNYNYTFSEYDVAPLELVWFGEGQSDVWLEGDRVVLPYGGQGVVKEYVYDGIAFIE